MPNKWNGGCCCDCPVNTYYEASNWTAEVGGTVSDAGGGVVELDGEVNPSSFITGTEAWHIDFLLKGKATFTIDTDTFIVDTINQTISVNGSTDSFGRSSGDVSQFHQVQLRVTPTHAYLLAFGNYFLSGSAPDFIYAHSLLTCDRAEDAPDSFTVVWDDAEVFGFAISDSTVAVDESGYTPVFTTRCWTAPSTLCPYFICKTLSRDHLYLTNPSHNRDYIMPDVSFSGWDPWAWYHNCVTATYETGGVFRCNAGMTDSSSLYQTLGIEQFRFNQLIGKNFCNWDSDIRRWGDIGNGLDCLTLPAYTTGGQVDIQWPTETAAAPYPKPYYHVTFGVVLGQSLSCCWNGTVYQCQYAVDSGGSVQADIECNDLNSGFTMSVSGSVSIETIVEVGTPNCDILYDLSVCDYVEDADPVSYLQNWGAVGATWTV